MRWPCPCLWVVDYCVWAIQRKWEREDARSHVLTQDKIKSEFLMFAQRAARQNTDK